MAVWSASSVNVVNIDEIYMSNMNLLCEPTNVIPRLSCLFSMAKAVSSPVEVVNSVTSESVNSFNCAMCALCQQVFPH